jgi:hypothetical protein
MRIHEILCAVFLGLGATSIRSSAGALAPEPAGIEWENMAKEFLTGHGISATTPDGVDFEAVLRANFAHSKLGLFEVWFPQSGLEKRGEDFQKCALSLMEAQEKWLDWLKPSGKEPKNLRDDLHSVEGWIKGWKLGTLTKSKSATAEDLIKELAAPDNLAEAHKRFADEMGRCEALGITRDTPANARLFLLPTRKDFCELVAFAGWLWPDHRGQYWVDGAIDWMQCFLGTDQAIALEYAGVGRKPGDYVTGITMVDRDPTVMQQQVVQLGMNSLWSELYGERLPPAFATGLSMNLVVDQFGEVNTRVDGDTRSHVTQKREQFVAGGQSQGGFLPKISAESRWRVDKGKDRYVHALHVSQKDGGEIDKKTKNRQACFALRADKGGSAITVAAPFLGAAAAATQEPAADYQGDFAEMLRAYKCAFIFWLETESAGNRKSSHEKFAQLLQKLAEPQESSEFEPLLSSVYDKAALSSADVDHASLEGKFLTWLSKQK